MKIEDCEVGMVIEPLKEFGKMHKGGLKIYSINKEKNKISIKNSCFVSSGHNPEYFEPINKFEVGEKVKWESFEGNVYNAEIFGISNKKDDYNTNYAITTFMGNGRVINRITKEEMLSKLKKKDELEKGDRFIDEVGNEVEILAREIDYNGELYYFGKRDDGYVSIWHEIEIKEVIY